MSKLDFALKDFYRKKDQTYPYLVVITLIIALTIFFIYFTTSLGLNLLTLGSKSEIYFTGSINTVYTNFSTFILVLILILAVIFIVIVSTTLIISKKRDIAIMKALGTLPRNLYGFYLIEVYIIFFLGFVLGLIFGFISFGIFAFVMFLLNYPIIFQFDWFFTPILFLSCIVSETIILNY